MKIVAFVASPHRSGNTAWTVEQLCEGARGAGAAAAVFYASELHIQPCRGCLACKRAGRCVVEDDMQPLYAALREADALVLGTPVYMGQMSGQAKVFTDRLFAQFSPRFSPMFKEANAGKRLILAFTQGNPDAGLFAAYFEYTKKLFAMLEFAVGEVVVVPGTRGKPAREQAGLAGALREHGAELVGGP